MTSLGLAPPTELLLDAFSHHQEALRDEHAGRHMRAGVPPRPRPRRRHLDQGVSPCVLFLSAEEREIIDKAATELEMSRSAYVSLLFEPRSAASPGVEVRRAEGAEAGRCRPSASSSCT